MLKGNRCSSLSDDKRVILPSLFRESLYAFSPQEYVVSPSPVNACLSLYPLTVWEDIESRIARLPNLDKTNQTIQWLVLGHATDIKIDKNNRFSLSDELIDFLRLPRNWNTGGSCQLRFVGLGHKIEIWGDSFWKSNVADKLGDENLVKSAALENLNL